MSMPYWKYKPYDTVDLPDRTWPNRVVERAPNPNDKRGSLTSLTRRTKTKLPKAKEALLRGEHDALAGLSAKEKTVLRELLERVVANLEAIDE